jgi:hypothetical protein
LVKKFADMIAMILHSQLVFDQRRNALGRLQLSPIPMCHGTFAQEADKALFLSRGKLRRSARHWLGFQGIVTALLQRIAPSKDVACMTPNAAGNLMEGQVLLEECYDTLPTFFKHICRTLRSRHGDTPFEDASIILHYLCGSQ